MLGRAVQDPWGFFGPSHQDCPSANHAADMEKLPSPATTHRVRLPEPERDFKYSGSIKQKLPAVISTRQSCIQVDRSVPPEDWRLPVMQTMSTRTHRRLSSLYLKWSPCKGDLRLEIQPRSSGCPKIVKVHMHEKRKQPQFDMNGYRQQRYQQMKRVNLYMLAHVCWSTLRWKKLFWNEHRSENSKWHAAIPISRVASNKNIWRH